MIFQEPMTSLNPVLTDRRPDRRGDAHPPSGSAPTRRVSARSRCCGWSRSPSARRARRLSAPVLGRHAPARHDRDGARCNPKLLIADEPTTALDVTIQAQILDLMLRAEGARPASAVILITHDLGIVAETCQRVVVMYAGRKVEEAAVAELFARPAHPYTRGLMASIARGWADGRASGSPRSRHGPLIARADPKAAPSRRAAPTRSRAARGRGAGAAANRRAGGHGVACHEAEGGVLRIRGAWWPHEWADHRGERAEEVLRARARVPAALRRRHQGG